MSELSLSVVIPCRNEARYLPGLLDALAAQTHRPDEIVIVDGNSTDGTPAVAQAWAAAHPGLALQVVANPHQHIPHALNLGIAAARGQLIARLDGHARPAPDYLARCRAALSETGAALVGGAWDVQPGAAGVIAQAIALAVSSRLGAGDARYRLAGAAAGAVDTVPFGCFPRLLWQTLGGYDETLLTNEDYEFAARVRAGGGVVWFDPAIRCTYFARPAFGALAAQYWRYGWWKAQMLKRHPRSLRGRQAAPALWAAVGLGGWLLAGWWPPLGWGLGGLWLIYLGLVVGQAVDLARGRPAALRLTLALVAAYGLIHFGWGLGVWAGAVGGPAPWSRPPSGIR